MANQDRLDKKIKNEGDDYGIEWKTMAIWHT
jgi:hypothetical protein